jgi:WD40 repeat protein
MTTTLSPVEDLFARALELPAAQRAALLATECAGDAAMRAAVEGLLRASEDAGEFLECGPRPGMSLGGYELLEEIGRGGFSTVWRARQTGVLEREVALKMIAPGMDSREVLRRFAAERQTLARMTHPGIARVFDAGTDASGRPYFVMELVTGAPLTEHCRSHRLPLAERLRLFSEACAAVTHAHQRGVIHRDLKPSNILAGPEGVKVIDFGIARLLEHPDTEGLTLAGHAVGTPQWMAPESFDGGVPDVRADVFSLGLLLCELVSGTPARDAAAWKAATFAQWSQLAAQPVRPPRTGTDLDAIMGRATAPEPERRYASVAELADDLTAFAEHRPVRARVPTRAYLIRRFLRRHRVETIAASVALAGIIAGGIVAWRKKVEADTARSAAEHNAGESERHATQSRGNLARSYLFAANRHLEDVDNQRALLWLLQAYETTTDAVERRLTGMSLATTLRAAPRLAKVWAPGGMGECAVFDPAAKRIACATGAAEVFIWSADPQNDTTLTLRHEGGTAWCGWNADGTRLFTQGAADVRLWDAASGQPLGKAVPHMPGGASFVTRSEAGFSAGGRRLLTYSAAGAQLLDAADGAPAGPLLKGPEPLTAAAVLPDGARCLLACGRQVLLVDSSTGAQLSAWQIKESARMLSLDARAERFTALCGTGRVEIFSLADTTAPAVTFSSSGVNYQAAFSPDGGEILTASFMGEARLYDSATGDRVREFPHDGGVSRAVWFQGSRRILATASWDNTVRLWQQATGKQVAVLHHGGRTMSVQAVAEPQRILTASADGSVRLYERARDSAAGGSIRARLRVSRTQPWAAGVAWISDHMVKLCRPETGEVIGGTMLHRHPVMQAVPVAGAERVATLTKDGTVHVWAAGGVLALPLATVPPSGAAVKDLAFSADGTRLLLLRANGSFTLCDGHGAVLCAQVRLPGRLRAWSVSQNDTLLVALGTDGKAQAWHMADGQPAGPAFGPESGAWTLTLSPGGDAVCLNEGPQDALEVKRAVRLWNPFTGQPITPPLEHYDDIGAVAFSPDGRLLATGSEDYQVIIWDRRTGQPAASSWQHSSWPKCLAFSPDSHVLGVVGHDSSFAFLRSADCTQIGTRRQWASPPQFIFFNASGDSLLAMRADDPRNARSVSSLYKINLTPDVRTDAALRDAVTLTSGMTLENDGVVRPLTAQELVALWRKMRPAAKSP